jgi:hypothetical protein
MNIINNVIKFIYSFNYFQPLKKNFTYFTHPITHLIRLCCFGNPKLCQPLLDRDIVKIKTIFNFKKTIYFKLFFISHDIFFRLFSNNFSEI